ncbi:hypothetical protein [[Bacillus] enclensis]|jgi:hypothetical protein|nr:hypothetical protein [[Bacillus] enclensis]
MVLTNWGFGVCDGCSGVRGVKKIRQDARIFEKWNVFLKKGM